MHKSQLAGFIIDCQTDDIRAAVEFWGQALGYQIKADTDPGDSRYVELDTGADDLVIEVQKVDHQSRVHLDIESDDIEAEVLRLEKLGARRIGTVKTWCVMEAPTGQRFCVVRPQRAAFADRANSWDNE